MISKYKIVFPDGKEKVFEAYSFESVSDLFKTITGKEFTSETVENLEKEGYKLYFIGYCNV